MEGFSSVSSAPYRAPTLAELVAWVVAERASLRREVPDRIHAQSGDREDWGVLTKSRRPDGDVPSLEESEAEHRSAIRGLPFAQAFERYIDRDLDGRHAVVRALWRMRSEAASGAARQSFRVCLALLQGSEPDEIRRRWHLSEFTFATAALHGLASLRAKTEDAARLTEMNTRAA